MNTMADHYPQEYSKNGHHQAWLERTHMLVTLAQVLQKQLGGIVTPLGRYIPPTLNT